MRCRAASEPVGMAMAVRQVLRSFLRAPTVQRPRRRTPIAAPATGPTAALLNDRRPRRLVAARLEASAPYRDRGRSGIACRRSRNRPRCRRALRGCSSASSRCRAREDHAWPPGPRLQVHAKCGPSKPACGSENAAPFSSCRTGGEDKDGVDIERCQEFVAGQARGEDRDAVVVFVELADRILDRIGRFASADPAARQIGLALHRQALDHQAGRHLVVGREHQRRVELLALEHVVLQHVAELACNLSLWSPIQRHHALVRLLARKLVLGVERDRAAPFAVHISPFPRDARRPECCPSPWPWRAGSGRSAPRPPRSSPARRRRLAGSKHR